MSRVRSILELVAVTLLIVATLFTFRMAVYYLCHLLFEGVHSFGHSSHDYSFSRRYSTTIPE